MTTPVEELIRTVETIWTKSNDVVQVFEPFRTLVDAVLDSREKKHGKVLEEFLGQFESRIKWKNLKDAEKVQRRLEYYRIMVKVYESEMFKNQDAAFDCYNKILCKTIVTITSRNIHKYLDKLHRDFDAVWKIVTKDKKLVPQFWDTVKLIENRYKTQNLPKDLKFHDQVLGAKAQYLFAMGYWRDALAIERDRVLSLDEYLSSIDEWPGIHFFLDMFKKIYGDWRSCLSFVWPVLKSYANGTAFRQEGLLNGIAQTIEEGKALFSQKKFHEAQKMFLLASKTIPKDGRPNLSMKNYEIEILFWHAKCQCRVGNHWCAMKHRNQCIQLLQQLRHFKDLQSCGLSVKFTLGDVFEDLAMCLFHVGYDDEALEFTRKAMKYPDKPHLSKNYAQLLVCLNKFRKASNFVDNNRQTFDDAEAAMIYYSSKSMEKVDKILFHSTKPSTMMNFIQMLRWREQGSTDLAIELYENDKVGMPTNSISYPVMYLELGQHHAFNECISKIVNAKEHLEEMTNQSLKNFKPQDSIRFHKYLVKTLKRKNPEARNLEECEQEVRKWSNSVSISLFVKQKLKLNSVKSIFSVQ